MDKYKEMEDYLDDNAEKLLALYLTSESKRDLCVWPDEIFVTEHSVVFNPDECPDIRIRCPGIDALDATHFTENFVSWDVDVGAYVVTGLHRDDHGRVVGDLAAVIRECVRDCNMSPYWEGLKDTLLANYAIPTLTTQTGEI